MKKQTINTLEIEVAIAMHYNPRIYFIVPNVSHGAHLHECDLLIISKAGIATEIEIKISKQDFKADFLKRHAHRSNKITYLYYAIPINLLDFAIEHLNAMIGIITVEREPQYHEDFIRVRFYRKAKQKAKYKWSTAETFNVLRLGVMRVWNLKRAVVRMKKDVKRLRYGETLIK